MTDLFFGGFVDITDKTQADCFLPPLCSSILNTSFLRRDESE